MDIQAVHQQDNVSNSSSRRRQYIVDSAFQWKYTLIIVVGVFLVASAMGIAMFGYMHQQARQGSLLGRSHDPWRNTRTIILFATLFSTVTVGGLITWGILLTHRVCGPLNVLKQHLATLRNGHFPKYRPLRKRDEFKELHSFFFETVDVLRERAELARKELDNVLADLKRLETNDEKQRNQAIETTCKSVTSLRDRVAESLEHRPSADLASLSSTPQSREPARCPEPPRKVIAARS